MAVLSSGRLVIACALIARYGRAASRVEWRSISSIL
jgi:hypothetical protein